MRDFYEVMGAPVELATYREAPGWMDWYDTEESQRILGYLGGTTTERCRNQSMMEG